MTNVTIKDMGFEAFKQELEIAQTANVTIGIHEGSGSVDGVTIAEYAAYNEYGTKHIPERSFMRTTFDDEVNNIQNQMTAQWAQVLVGKTTVYRALSLIGLRHEIKVKEKINSNIQPKNAPSTIEKKKSSRTLIDTGTMLNTVRYVLNK